MGGVTQQVSGNITFEPGEKPRSILRPVSKEDLMKVSELRSRELQFQEEVARIVRQYGLSMKVVDVELQFDGNKMTVFFTADQRVDFRALVKELAGK